MRVTDDRLSLIDVLVFLAFSPWIGAGYAVQWITQRIAARKAAKVKPKAKRKAPSKPKTIRTAQAHRRQFGVAPALRIINGGRA